MGLADFPAGVKPGHALHALLERAEFETASEASLLPLAHDTLSAFSLDADDAPLVARAMVAAIDTPLLGVGTFRLRDVALGARLSEMEFHLPVVPRGGQRLSSAALASALDHWGSPALKAYAKSLRDLAFVPLAGSIRGFIDLVVQHDGRFYVVDYKSNHLGPTAGDYSRASLETAMAEHHYHLQQLLYTVAVHRHLKSRVAGYAYETGFGGALYLFLRGMAPEHAPGTGVYFERPSHELVTALDAVIEGQAP